MQTGDFDAFMRCFALPLVVETFESKRLLQSERDIQHVYDAVREFRTSNGIVDVFRENVSAAFVDTETIAATHVTRMLQAGDILFGRPYPAFSRIKCIKGEWRIQFCQYAVDDPSQLNTALTSCKKETPRRSAALPTNDEDRP